MNGMPKATEQVSGELVTMSQRDFQSGPSVLPQSSRGHGSSPHCRINPITGGSGCVALPSSPHS